MSPCEPEQLPSLAKVRSACAVCLVGKPDWQHVAVHYERVVAVCNAGLAFKPPPPTPRELMPLQPILAEYLPEWSPPQPGLLARALEAIRRALGVLRQ